MPDFTITVSENDAKIIKKIATDTSRPAREMIEQFLSNWAENQIKGFFIDKIKGKTTQELIVLLGDIQ